MDFFTKKDDKIVDTKIADTIDTKKDDKIVVKHKDLRIGKTYNKLCKSKLMILDIEITKDFKLTANLVENEKFMKKFERGLSLKLIC